MDRDLLKEKVKSGVLKLLVGTDAASTGLNLQTLGSLIKETDEYLDEEWENTAEVLNSKEAIAVFLNGW